MVVQLASAALAKQGYEVFSATSPAEALKAATDGLDVDLILSDIVMPEMSGPELIRKVQRHSPSTLAVLMSGYLADELLPEIPLVRKPFVLAELISVVKRVLEESEQALRASSRARDTGQRLQEENKRIQGELKEIAHATEEIMKRSEDITGRQRPR